MANMLSPDIELKEQTIQTTVSRASTGRAAIAVKSAWGPSGVQLRVSNETELVDLIGRPTNDTIDYFMSSANFLQYGNDLRLVRAIDPVNSRNSSGIVHNIEWTITAAGSNYKVGDKVAVKYSSTTIEENGLVTEVDTEGKIVSIFIPTAKIIRYAKSINMYPDLGSLWTASVTSESSGVAASITLGKVIVDSGILLQTPEESLETIQGKNFQEKCEKYKTLPIVGAYAGELGDDIEVEIVSKKDFDAYKELTVYPSGEKTKSTVRNVFQYAPLHDDQYCIVVRLNGVIQESYILSTRYGDRDAYNMNIFMDDYFANGASKFIFATATGWIKGFSGVIRLGGGKSANDTITAGHMMEAWDKMADKESLQVNLLIAGACAGENVEFASTVQKHVVSIADERQDCVAFISPPRELIVNKPLSRAVANLVEWRKGISSSGESLADNMNIDSTYAFIDGNYKYQYDKYHGLNRWVPFAADIAGLCARTDANSYVWKSPAGYNRGQILNVRKVAIEPRKPHRDDMYVNGINPITGASGGGAGGFILNGDKTATLTQSPFDRINVRRLFNMIKTAIGSSSKYKLYENNDNFTQASFRMETDNYLRQIQSLGGIYDRMVICDSTNNTPAVIDRNEFIWTCYVKPSKSINYITLNFVATETGADFDEIIGRVA